LFGIGWGVEKEGGCEDPCLPWYTNPQYIKPEGHPYSFRMKIQLFTSLSSLVTAAVLNFPPDGYNGRTVSYQGVKLGGSLKLSSKITVFRKIPYAEPPLGNLRFRPPLNPTTKFTTNTMLNIVGPKCMQVSSSSQDNTSEDCLHLNVYTPSTGSKYPVVVYIHGGSFTGGSAIDYNGVKLANDQQIVVVTVNYRLGVFGFLAGNELQNEKNSDGQPSLNVGLLDQKKAFEWVRNNIAAFGGDPNKITAMGQSAGAISIGAHLLAQSGNQKLFNRAYLLSGAVPLLYLTSSQLDFSFKQYADSVGCSTNEEQLACLRNLSAANLNANSAYYAAFPILDGTYITNQAITQLKAGQFSKVPLFIQTNADEGSVFPLYYGIQNVEEATARIKTLIPILSKENQNKLVGLYNPSTHPIYPGAAFGDLFADAFFYCPSTLMADIYSKNNVKVYTSKSNHIPVVNPFAGLPVPTGVFHGSELPFLFKETRVVKKEERIFAKNLRKFLREFADKSYPNPTWSTYASGSNTAYDIETQQVVEDDRTLKCNKIVEMINLSLQLE
jgi:para-nitrobenzyl esterase